jgi:hypothetical protein
LFFIFILRHWLSITSQILNDHPIMVVICVAIYRCCRLAFYLIQTVVACLGIIFPAIAFFGWGSALLSVRMHPQIRPCVFSSIAIFLHAAPAPPRGFELYEYYKSITFPREFDVQFYFVGLLQHNTTDPPNIAMPDDYLRWQSYPIRHGVNWPIRETAKYFLIFNYALEKTTARWIFRTFDDIYINCDLLLNYLRTLERRFDPLVDAVARGDCILNPHPYLAGGPGTLLSRAAVRRLAPLGDYMVWTLQDELDDMRFGKAMKHAGIDVANSTSSAFIGFQYSDKRMRGFRTQNYNDLIVQDECPDEPRRMQKVRRPRQPDRLLPHK